MDEPLFAVSDSWGLYHHICGASPRILFSHGCWVLMLLNPPEQETDPQGLFLKTHSLPVRLTAYSLRTQLSSSQKVCGGHERLEGWEARAGVGVGGRLPVALVIEWYQLHSQLLGRKCQGQEAVVTTVPVCPAHLLFEPTPVPCPDPCGPRCWSFLGYGLLAGTCMWWVLGACSSF